MNRHIIETYRIGDRSYGVEVDGLVWCYAVHEPAGMHGAFYTLRYSRDGSPIEEAAGRGSKPSEVVLWSDKRWLSGLGFYGRPEMAKKRAEEAGQYKPIYERIEETVARLIKKKLIISPDERARRAETARAVQQQRIEQTEAEDRERLEIEARKAVRDMQLPDFGGSVNDGIVARIVQAMEWARSNT